MRSLPISMLLRSGNDDLSQGPRTVFGTDGASYLPNMILRPSQIAPTVPETIAVMTALKVNALMPRKIMTPSPGVSILSLNIRNWWPRPRLAILPSIKPLEDCASVLCASRMQTASVPRSAWQVSTIAVLIGQRRLAPAPVQNGVGGRGPRRRGGVLAAHDTDQHLNHGSDVASRPRADFGGRLGHLHQVFESVFERQTWPGSSAFGFAVQ